MGGLPSSRKAVRRFPAHRVFDPPTSPPRNGRGRSWGDAVGRSAHALQPQHSRRRVAADVPARLAQRLQRRRPQLPSLRHRRDRRDGAQRQARRSSRSEHLRLFRGPASGVAGDRGDDPAGGERSSAARRAQRRPVRQAGLFTRSVKEPGPRSPGTGTGRSNVRRLAVPTRMFGHCDDGAALIALGERTGKARSAAVRRRHVRSGAGDVGEPARGMGARQGRDHGPRDSGSTRSAPARPRTAWTRPKHLPTCSSPIHECSYITDTVAASSDRRVVHSDRGGHYRWPGWLSRIADAKLVRSMSCKGYSPDNAACEGFFGRRRPSCSTRATGCPRPSRSSWRPWTSTSAGTTRRRSRSRWAAAAPPSTVVISGSLLNQSKYFAAPPCAAGRCAWRCPVRE